MTPVPMPDEVDVDGADEFADGAGDVPAELVVDPLVGVVGATEPSGFFSVFATEIVNALSALTMP